MSQSYPCVYCQQPVRGRYVTYRVLDTNGIDIEFYSHGKCRWFPELWKLIEKRFRVDVEKYETKEGEFGEIISFSTHLKFEEWTKL